MDFDRGLESLRFSLTNATISKLSTGNVLLDGIIGFLVFGAITTIIG
jgi:hypothetical protein